MAKSIILTLAFTTAASHAELHRLWSQGKDFRMSTTGQYCSVRDIDKLKQDFDNIVIRCVSRDKTTVLERCIWTHPLAGLTTYV
jgi:hypothetical protein